MAGLHPSVKLCCNIAYTNYVSFAILNEFSLPQLLQRHSHFHYHRYNKFPLHSHEQTEWDENYANSAAYCCAYPIFLTVVFLFVASFCAFNVNVWYALSINH